MLSKELKELEINKLINRIVQDTQPVSVEYVLTEHGKTLQPIITNLTEWGIKQQAKNHRKIDFAPKVLNMI